MDNCVDYLVSRGIPLDEARESCDIAYKLMQGHEVPVPDAVQPTQDIYNFVPVSEGTEERYVLGVALVPNHLDNNGTFFPPTTVKKTAYNFMVNYQANKFMHMLNLDKKDVSIVESYVAPTDMTVHGRVIKKGTWLMGLVIHNDQLWNHIKMGKIKGLSIGAHVLGGAMAIAPSKEELDD